MPIWLPGWPGISIIAHRVGIVGHLELDHRVVELAILELLAEHLARAFAGVLAGNGVDHAVFGGLFMGPGLDVFAHLVRGSPDRGIRPDRG